MRKKSENGLKGYSDNVCLFEMTLVGGVTILVVVALSCEKSQRCFEVAIECVFFFVGVGVVVEIACFGLFRLSSFKQHARMTC